MWGDGAYLGQTEVIRECSPRARDFTQRHCRYKGQIVDEVAWAKNRTKSRVRAKVEHVFQVMKLKFGFVKVRYRTEEERAPAARYLCTGESVCEPQKTARRSVGRPPRTVRAVGTAVLTSSSIRDPNR